MLKIIAIIIMTLDHIGHYFNMYLPYELYMGLRMLGRLAFPIFCYYLACGYQRTSDLNKYFLRLSAFAVLSEPVKIYSMYLAGIDVPSRNIFFTLACGLIFIGGLDIFIRNLELPRKGNNHVKGLLIGLVTMFCSCLIGFFFNVDYGIYGVILPGVFYLAQQRGMWGLDFNYCDLLNKVRQDQIQTKTARELFKRIAYLASLYMYIFTTVMLVLNYLVPKIFRFNSIQILAILAVPLCYLPYLQRKTKKPRPIYKYIFYIYYPLHLLVLGFIVSRI